MEMEHVKHVIQCVKDVDLEVANHVLQVSISTIEPEAAQRALLRSIIVILAMMIKIASNVMILTF